MPGLYRFEQRRWLAGNRCSRCGRALNKAAVRLRLRLACCASNDRPSLQMGGDLQAGAMEGHRRDTLDLPDWNEALKQSNIFNCSPPKQPRGTQVGAGGSERRAGGSPGFKTRRRHPFRSHPVQAMFKDGNLNHHGVGRVRAGRPPLPADLPRAWQGPCLTPACCCPPPLQARSPRRPGPSSGPGTRRSRPA